MSKMRCIEDDVFYRALEVLKDNDIQAFDALSVHVNSVPVSGELDIFVHELLSRSERAFRNFFMAQYVNPFRYDGMNDAFAIRSLHNGKRLLQRLIEMGPDYLDSLNLDGKRLVNLVKDGLWLEPHIKFNGMPGSGQMMNLALRCNVIDSSDYAYLCAALVRDKSVEADKALHKSCVGCASNCHAVNAAIFPADAVGALEESIESIDESKNTGLSW